MQPSPMFLETLKAGITKKIDVGAFDAKEIRFYDQNSSPIKEIYRMYGYCNFLKVLNTALTITMKVSLDGVESRSEIYPGGFTETMSDVQFTSIKIENLTNNVSLGGEIFILVGFQPPAGSPVAIAGLR